MTQSTIKSSSNTVVLKSFDFLRASSEGQASKYLLKVDFWANVNVARTVSALGQGFSPRSWPHQQPFSVPTSAATSCDPSALTRLLVTSWALCHGTCVGGGSTQASPGSGGAHSPRQGQGFPGTMTCVILPVLPADASGVLTCPLISLPRRRTPFPTASGHFPCSMPLPSRSMCFPSCTQEPQVRALGRSWPAGGVRVQRWWWICWPTVRSTTHDHYGAVKRVGDAFTCFKYSGEM